MRRSKTLGPYSVRFVWRKGEKQPLIEEMMNVFPFILEELGMIALMEVVFLLLRVKGRGASTKKRSET